MILITFILTVRIIVGQKDLHMAAGDPEPNAGFIL